MGDCMYSIALRFAEKFAPEEGTIAAHEQLILKNGYVWYGKMGSAVSDANISKVMSEDAPKILLIHSGGVERYWAYIEEIKKEIPPFDEFPVYYHGIAEKFKTWFKIKRFERADNSIMSKCTVSSSGQSLSLASKHSMSPYFLIKYIE